MLVLTVYNGNHFPTHLHPPPPPFSDFSYPIYGNVEVAQCNDWGHESESCLLSLVSSAKLPAVDPLR